MDFESWWQSLDKRLHTSNNKGSKAEARNEWDKLKPDEDLVRRIMSYTAEKKRQDWKIIKAGGKTSPWKHAVRLIRYRFWEDELPSTMGELQKLEKSRCACGNEAKWKNLCWQCYDKAHRETDWRCTARKARLSELGLVQAGMSKGDVIESCRTWLNKNGLLANVVKKRAPTATGR